PLPIQRMRTPSRKGIRPSSRFATIRTWPDGFRSTALRGSCLSGTRVAKVFLSPVAEVLNRFERLLVHVGVGETADATCLVVVDGIVKSESAISGVPPRGVLLVALSFVLAQTAHAAGRRGSPAWWDSKVGPASASCEL